jgi:mRNA-degrading endonuclease RelE of RelBE toxin-antitoxin system
MSYKVKTLLSFEKQARRLIKKYPSLKKEIAGLIESLKQNPKQGVPLANGCYKIRLGIASKGKGKSGGARIITHLVVRQQLVYLISVYDKSEIATLTDNDILGLVQQIDN